MQSASARQTASDLSKKERNGRGVCRCVFAAAAAWLSLYLLGEMLRVLREALNVHDEVLWQLGDDVLPLIAIHHLLRSLAG